MRDLDKIQEIIEILKKDPDEDVRLALDFG
jgi:hypothetical protein